MNVTYVLGAGFSRAAGLPLINNFHESLTTYHDEITRRYSQQVFDEYKRVINNGASIEDSFDTLEERGVLSDVFLLRAAVNAVIVAACERYLRTGTSKKVAPYSNFLKLVKNQNATVITLNYDTILECTDYINSIETDDGLGITRPYLSFDYCLSGWSPYRNITEVRTDDRFHLWFHDIPLIKLHGGMNFFFCPIHKWAFYADMTNNSHRGICPVEGCRKEVEPGIVPPRRIKDISEFKALWGIAKERLIHSDQITLVGINLNERDKAFNDLIGETLGECQLGFINFEQNPTEQSFSSWQTIISDRLGFNISKENIFLDGFDRWIAQMDE